jgi:hypothetical protein
VGGRGRVWRGVAGPGQAVEQFDEGDKQALLAYHRGYLHISFRCGNHDDVAAAAAGQAPTRPFLFMTRPRLGMAFSFSCVLVGHLSWEWPFASM